MLAYILYIFSWSYQLVLSNIYAAVAVQITFAVYNSILLLSNNSLVYEVSVHSKTCKEVFQPVTLLYQLNLAISSLSIAGPLRALCHCIRSYLRTFINDPLLYEVTHCM